MIGTIHDSVVAGRRIQMLARQLGAVIPAGARVLDIGAGDGQISAKILADRPDLTIEGIDVLIRDSTLIPVHKFDGYTVPFEAGTFDVTLFVDVLHHTSDPARLLLEAQRICRHAIILKDHTKDGLLAGPTLRAMDWFGNAHDGVVLPYHYWTERQWRDTFTRLGMTVDLWQSRLSLFPWPASLLFDRSLHFIARLKV